MTSKQPVASWQSRKGARSIWRFHCQQAAEKYLKCLLTYLGIQAPRTHDLKALVLLVPAENRLALRIEDVVELNPYSVDVRYADDWREPDLGDARRALALASEVRAEVRQAIPPAALV